MPFSVEDKTIIKHYRLTYKWGRKGLMKNFPQKNWSAGGLDVLLRKIDRTNDVVRKEGSGRKKTQRTEENIDVVEELVLSQHSQPCTRHTQREIADVTGISQSSVSRITNWDLNLRSYRKIILSFRKRLRMIIEADGGHIAHLL